MPLKLPVLLVIFLHGFAIIASASGLDPIRDFCVADTASATNTLQCKNSSAAMVEDFVFSGIKFPGKVSEMGFSAESVNVKVFPGLNTLGMSFVRADFDVGGVNVPQFHPRATEVAFVLEGRIYSGFVDTDNKIFAKVIGKGEVMVFPRGLVHALPNECWRYTCNYLGEFLIARTQDCRGFHMLFLVLGSKKSFCTRLLD
ncbi:hypothetical protein SLEP1_g5410 [Rubroshorea leprosula]|uniref:Germin-like protein n=1 Tax=Rubroshorea leprosula TaxID=152421 RepID=A0AAV5HS48_9ROSI|nr:hypothetical protein SLEP1_g5410 [Rubroshorea leprosula]